MDWEKLFCDVDDFCLVADRQPVPHTAKSLGGRLFGDEGYISADLFTQCWNGGLQLVTHPQQHEERLDAVARQNLVAEAIVDRNRQRPTKEHFAD